MGGKNTFHNSTSTRQWRNLNDIPEDVQYEIHNYLPPEQRAQTLRSLSTTARSLRSAAQNTLLRKVRIELDKPLKGSINVLLCDAIHFLELTGFCRDGAKLSHIMKLLPEMTKLRTLRIHQVNLSKVFIQAFLETAANIPIPLRVEFEHNRYPTHLVVPKALCISDLRFSYVQTDSLKFWRSVLRASASTLQELHVCAADEVRLTEEERIDLPVLRVLYLAIKDGRDAPAFITPNKTITKLGLIGLEDWPSPSHLQSSVLPHLRELIAPLQVVNQLVPGRPVEAIEVTRFNRFPDGENWVGEKLGQVRKLQLHAPLSPRMAEQIETRFPSLESLWVKVFDRVRGPFAPYLGSFSFRISWKSSKFSLPLSASRTYTLGCVILEHCRVTASRTLLPNCEKLIHASHLLKLHNSGQAPNHRATLKKIMSMH